jgi:2-aminoethylphosphonate aminotransferase
MIRIKKNVLLNPGPATTTDTVKYAQVVPDICPREFEFGKVMESVSKDLVSIAGGDEGAFIAVLLAGSGTAAMDATINSVIPPNGKLLVINNGAYGKRMVQIARAYAIEVVELKYDSACVPSLADIDRVLATENNVAAVSMIHHETTTGILNPVKEIGAIVKKHEKVFIVDTISSFAGVPLDIEDFKIDFMMSTSNKCIQGMAGVAFVICRRSELEKIKDYPRRSYYLSLYDQYDYFKEKYQMRFTPPVQTIYALRKAINEFLEEGYENRVKRYTENWQLLREGVRDIGYEILTKPEDESHLLITLIYPSDENFDFDILHDKLYEAGFTIYPGKIGRKKTFRLANMGAIDKHDIQAFLDKLREVLSEMNVQIPV